MHFSSIKKYRSLGFIPEILIWRSGLRPIHQGIKGVVYHQLLEHAQTHVHQVSDAIQPLSSPSSPAFNLSQHQGLFQWVGSSHQVAKVLELQLQHQSFQWTFGTDFLCVFLPRLTQILLPTPPHPNPQQKQPRYSPNQANHLLMTHPPRVPQMVWTLQEAQGRMWAACISLIMLYSKAKAYFERMKPFCTVLKEIQHLTTVEQSVTSGWVHWEIKPSKTHERGHENQGRYKNWTIKTVFFLFGFNSFLSEQIKPPCRRLFKS